MAEEENGAAAAAAETQPPQVKMKVLTQFVRDLSFENILAQRGTGGTVEPDVTVAVNLDAKKRTVEHQYEVSMKLNITSKNKSDDQPLFILELDYAGVFHIEGVPQEQMHPFLLIECPRMIFPFVRRVVNDVTRDGGFPPLNLDTIDFMQLYKQEIGRRQAEQTEEPAPIPN